jgi:hypothetical protein
MKRLLAPSAMPAVEILMRLRITPHRYASAPREVSEGAETHPRKAAPGTGIVYLFAYFPVQTETSRSPKSTAALATKNSFKEGAI